MVLAITSTQSQLKLLRRRRLRETVSCRGVVPRHGQEYILYSHTIYSNSHRTLPALVCILSW
jgi:hypothetical protein